jgi:hypothetical protein
MEYQFSLKAMKLFLAGCLTISMLAPASATIAPLWYSTSVDSASSTATFLVKFDSAPDLFTADEFGRQADSFQFWVDSEAPDAIARTYGALSGDLPPDTQTVISAQEIPSLNQLEIIWPKPLTWSGPRDRGGWGSIEGHMPYTLTPDNVLSFNVPLSLLRDMDGKFYYTFETYQYGAWGGVDYSGVSGKYYSVPAVPEPSAAALFFVGLSMLMACTRRRAGTRQLNLRADDVYIVSAEPGRSAARRGSAASAFFRVADSICCGVKPRSSARIAPMAGSCSGLLRAG